MGIFEHDYPYTNAHELNLDFVLNKMAQIDVDAVASVTETVARHTDEIAQLEAATSDIDTIRSNASSALSIAEQASVKADEIDDVKQDVVDIKDELETTLKSGAPAIDISYDNSESHLSATTVQRAIDLLVQSGGGGGGTASEVLYDNSSSGLSAGNVQQAIDELTTDLMAVSGEDFFATLAVGSTQIEFTSDAITNSSTFDFYTSVYGINPVVVSVSNHTLTLVFDTQDEPVDVKVVVK